MYILEIIYLLYSSWGRH